MGDTSPLYKSPAALAGFASVAFTLLMAYLALMHLTVSANQSNIAELQRVQQSNLHLVEQIQSLENRIKDLETRTQHVQPAETLVAPLDQRLRAVERAVIELDTKEKERHLLPHLPHLKKK